MWCREGRLRDGGAFDKINESVAKVSVRVSSGQVTECTKTVVCACVCSLSVIYNEPTSGSCKT